MEVKINREIRNYTEAVFFGLSLRQIIFSACALAVAVAVFFLLKPSLGTETTSWICILAAAPFAALGFVKYNGMTAEKFVIAWVKSEFLTPKKLTFKSTNTYYELMKPVIEQKEKEANVIIYAHHMNDGSMFAGLENYRSKDYWSSHKTISFDTLNKKASYDILAVFAVPVDESDKNTFKIYEFVNAYDSEHYSSFISKCKALSFYETGVSAKQGDKLLTLATCEYTNNNGRLVVVAKRTTR